MVRSLKNPVTPPGIDPGTVRLVAQRLNYYATPGPSLYSSLTHAAGLTFKCANDADLLPPSILSLSLAPSPYANPNTDKQNEVSVYKCVGK